MPVMQGANLPVKRVRPSQRALRDTRTERNNTDIETAKKLSTSIEATQPQVFGGMKMLISAAANLPRK